MSSRRRKYNVSLIILTLILGGLAAWIYRRPPLVLSPPVDAPDSPAIVSDTTISSAATSSAIAAAEDTTVQHVAAVSDLELTGTRVKATRFSDAELGTMISNHPFRIEAVKVLNGHLEESDSLCRHKILSYCEHLRTSYTTKDLDFIRQVFSDDALIIVGHVVKTGDDGPGMSHSSKVNYYIHSKQGYLARLARIFNARQEIDVQFSDFKILRHPTLKGIYGVTLRQKYTTKEYSDDGFLFLLWDFRDPSMPLIHVRTWQPSRPIINGEEELIEMSDFNLE